MSTTIVFDRICVISGQCFFSYKEKGRKNGPYHTAAILSPEGL